MKSVRIPEELRSIAKLAKKQNWDIVRKRGSKHLCWISPSGQKVFGASTPSCYKGTKNFISELRDAGLDIPRA